MTILGKPAFSTPPSRYDLRVIVFDHFFVFPVQLMSEEVRTDGSDASKMTPRMEAKPDWRSASLVPRSAASIATSPEPNRSHKQLTEGMSMAMEVAQVLVSFLYAWGLDSELDKMCVEKLGMLQPRQAVNYGIISKTGFITLLLPTNLHRRKSIDLPQPQERIRDILATVTRHHYSTSSTLTTVHLIGLVSVANTLMNIQNATFHPDHEKRRKIHR